MPATTDLCRSEFIREAPVHPMHFYRQSEPIANEFAPTGECVHPMI